jgi:1,4-alpha-glucan branching enzyme
MTNKMPGDEWQRFANLRLLYLYMFTHPGKKLLFMGTEFGQGTEWNSATTLDWYVLQYDFHQGMQLLVKDLNRLYHSEPTLHHYEFEWQGFDWIDCHDAEQSILSYLRKKDDDFLVVVVNFTPVPRHGYRIGVPRAGRYTEIFNSDSHYYAGSGVGNGGVDMIAEDRAWMDRPYSITITVPPLGGLVLRPMEPAPKPVAVIEAEVVEEAEEEAITPLKTAIGRRVSAEAELAQPE